ncbi:MAG: hypothetical protein ACFFDT_12065 [Candidatus Hodarchaeota archaeon]
MRKKNLIKILFFIIVSISFLGINSVAAFHGPGQEDEDFEYKSKFAIDWLTNQCYGKLWLPVIYTGTDWIHEDEGEHYWRHTSTYHPGTGGGGGDKIKFLLYSSDNPLVWHGVYIWIYDNTYNQWQLIDSDTGSGYREVSFYRFKADLSEEQWSTEDENYDGWYIFEVKYRVKAQCLWLSEQYDLYGRISFYNNSN